MVAEDFSLFGFVQALRDHALISNDSLERATSDSLETLSSDAGDRIRNVVSKNTGVLKAFAMVTNNLVIACMAAKTVLPDGDFADMWRNFRIAPDVIDPLDLDAFEKAHFDLEILTVSQGRDPLLKDSDIAPEVVIERLTAMRNFEITPSNDRRVS